MRFRAEVAHSKRQVPVQVVVPLIKNLPVALQQVRDIFVHTLSVEPAVQLSHSVEASVEEAASSS